MFRLDLLNPILMRARRWAERSCQGQGQGRSRKREAIDNSLIVPASRYRARDVAFLSTCSDDFIYTNK